MKKMIAIILALTLALTACASCLAASYTEKIDKAVLKAMLAGILSDDDWVPREGDTGLPDTEMTDEADLEAMLAEILSDDDGVLQEGDTGLPVIVLQSFLAANGYYHTRVDGEFGPNTKAALEAYQKDTGEEVTGTADADVIAAMFAPDIWLDIVARDDVEISEDIRIFVSMLIEAELLNDGEYSGVAGALLIANALASGDTDKLLTALLALFFHDYDGRDDPNSIIIFSLLGNLYGDSEKMDDVVRFVRRFTESMNHMDYIDVNTGLQDLILEDLLDDDDMTDVEIILHLIDFFYDRSNDDWSLVQLYIVLAAVDFLDDTHYEDFRQIRDIIKLQLAKNTDENEYEESFEDVKNRIKALVDALDREGRSLSDGYLRRVLLTDYFDDDESEDVEEILRLVLAAKEAE